MLSRRSLLSAVALLSIFNEGILISFADETSDSASRRFIMEDAYGNVVTDENFAGKFSLVYFGYMGCPDVCPTSLMTMSDVMKTIGGRADQVLPVFVTVDPDRDTAKALRDFVSNFDKRFIALRGPKEYTDHMAKLFKAKYEFRYSDPGDKKNYTVDHTVSITLVGPDGEQIKRYPHGMTSDEIARDLAGIIDGNPVN